MDEYTDLDRSLLDVVRVRQCLVLDVVHRDRSNGVDLERDSYLETDERIICQIGINGLMKKKEF